MFLVRSHTHSEELSKDFGDGKENVKKNNNSRCNQQKTTLHVQHTFFVHFFAVTARA